MAEGTSSGLDHEVIVIGAGVCGIYQLHRLLELGVDATVLEAGDDLGGTWYWNRYPGARFDSESISYGYSFSPELLQEWDWKERFSGQPENFRYLSYVADKFDLRKHMQFNVTVSSAGISALWRGAHQFGRRWYTVSSPTLSAISPITCTPVAPVPMTATRWPVRSTGSCGQL